MKYDIYKLYMEYSQEEIYDMIKKEIESQEDGLENNVYDTCFDDTEFEIVYTVIYGSQIQMLEEIKRNDNLPLPFLTTLEFYLNHSKHLPMHRKFNDNPLFYFKWLEEVNLIDEGDGGYIVTSFGLEFLKYIKDKNFDVSLKIW